jgi:hypothetical protein
MTGYPMNRVLPRPAVRTSAPTRPLDQPSIRPSAAKPTQAPAKISHCDTSRNQRCQSKTSFGSSSSTRAGSAILSTHQFMGSVKLAAPLTVRAVIIPSTAQTTSNRNDVIGGEIGVGGGSDASKCRE